MTILGLLILLILIGVGLYLVRMIPMDDTIKKIITIVAILVVVLWIVDLFGLFGPLNQTIGHHR